MVVVLPFDTGGEEKNDAEQETESATKLQREEYVETMEEKLSKILSEAIGIGKVKVMITIEDEGESVVNKDVSRENEAVQESTVLQNLKDDEIPYVTKQKMPKIKGVIVVAQGANNGGIKTEIMESVMALFDLQMNRIKVLSMG